MENVTNPNPTGTLIDPLLAEGVQEKTYARPNINLTQEELNKDIPEATFTAPPGGGNNAYQQPFGDSKPKKEKAPVMPEMTELTDGEKSEAAERMAETILDGYEWLHGGANSLLKISDRKMRKLVEAGELDPKVPIPWTDGEFVPFIDFVREFNETSEQTLKVDPKFRKKVIPPLTRVLQKRGAGMTDEHYLLVAFSQDIIVKTSMFYQMKRQVNDILQLGREHTELYRSGAPRPRTQPVQPQQPYEQQAQQPQQGNPTFEGPPAPPVPAGQQAVYQEPEERVALQDDQDIKMFTDAGKTSSFAPMPSRDESLPQFGNSDKLHTLEKIHKKEEKKSERTKKRDTHALKRKRAVDKVPGKKTRKKSKLGI